ncbi:hypothetical protein [Planotetraspora sp. GP83]
MPEAGLTRIGLAGVGLTRIGLPGVELAGVWTVSRAGLRCAGA